MRLLTITSNDLGISWGPAIHFLELWNGVRSIAPELDVEGIAPSWTELEPITPPRFPLRVIRVPNLRSWRQVYYDARVALLLLAFGHRYDLVYVRLSHWHLLQMLALRLRRLPFAVELNGLAKEDAHSSGRDSFSSWLVRFQERWLVSRAGLCIAVSDGIADAARLRYAPKGDVVTISNGVAGAFFVADTGEGTAASAPPTVIYVGTFTSWDGARDVVALARRCPDVRFTMVGDGPGRAALQDEGLSNVTFTGTVKYTDLPALYRRADCAIVLYEYERHRNVKLSSIKTLEYVASRLPVFTTAVPGQEFIERYGVGKLVAPEEDVREAFLAFLRALPAYREAYRRIGPTLPSEIGWESTARLTSRALRAVSVLRAGASEVR